MKPRIILSFVLAMVFAGTPPVAAAQDVTIERFRQLVSEAAEDPSAAARLRRIDSVDGRPVDLATALGSATGDDLRRRLELLATPGGPSGQSDEARSQARDILAGSSFRDPRTPKPLKSITDWIGDRAEAFGNALDRIAASLPGGEATLWTTIALLIVGAAAWFAARLGRRRGLLEHPLPSSSGRDGNADPKALEGAADEAEGRGDLAASIRLRFHAGILRLGQRGVLPRASTMTSEEMAAVLRSRTFDDLAATFDRIVYGHRPAAKEDVLQARDGWRALEAEVRA